MQPQLLYHSLAYRPFRQKAFDVTSHSTFFCSHMGNILDELVSTTEIDRYVISYPALNGSQTPCNASKKKTRETVSHRPLKRMHVQDFLTGMVTRKCEGVCCFLLASARGKCAPEGSVEGSGLASYFARSPLCAVVCCSLLFWCIPFWKKKKRFDDSLGICTPSQFPLVRSSAQDKGIAFCDFAIRHVPESPKTSLYNSITNAISLTKICWFSNVNTNLSNCSPVLGNCDVRHEMLLQDEMNGVNKMKVVISLSWLSCLVWFVSLRLGLLRCAAVTDRTGHDNADDSTGANVGATSHLHSRIVPERCGFGKGADERCRGLLRSRRQELLW